MRLRRPVAHRTGPPIHGRSMHGSMIDRSILQQPKVMWFFAGCMAFLATAAAEKVD